MAISLSIIGGAQNNGSFVAQVTGGLQSTVTAVLGEAVGADYVVRRKFAQKCEVNLPQMAAAVAVAVASQVQSAAPAAHTDLTNVTDTEVANALSGIFTQLAYASILPS